MLIDNKIIIARHVDIVEENVKCIGFNDQTDCDNESNVSASENLNDDVFESADEIEANQNKVVKENDTENKELKVSRKSTRDRKSPVRYPETESHNVYVNYCRIDTPWITPWIRPTFEEALNSDDKKNWRKAMDQEINCINKNKTWKLVNRIKEKRF